MLPRILPIAVWCLVAPLAGAAWNLPAAADPPGGNAAADPRTYPDAAGLDTRFTAIKKALATNDLGKWRRGYFAGGDPGKYLPGAAMARLLLDPKDPEAQKYLNDERSAKEHYHFAAVNWARMLPVFGDALTPETRKVLQEQAARYGAYLEGTGTENHKTMWMTSANVLPSYLEDGRLAKQSKEAALANAKRQLRNYVKGLYAAGQGEWDSSTYLMFDINGLLNVYDFAKDPETRLIARAGLDWLVAGYALKYRDGVYTAPNQRGFAKTPAGSIADQTGWLWWGGNAKPSDESMRNFLYTVHPATSAWKPNRVLTRIARKEVAPLPVEQRNSKPNYWYGKNEPPTPGQYRETVFSGRHHTLGSLWNGWGGQMTRFQWVASGPKGGIAFTGGHPTGGKYEDGNGKYDQSAQVGGALISVARLPADEPLRHVFFSLPEEATAVEKEGWWILQAGDAFAAVHPIGGAAVKTESELSDKQKQENADALAKNQAPRHSPRPLLKIAGDNPGFILETADKEEAGSAAAFAAALRSKTKLDASRWETGSEITYTTLAGKVIRLRYQADKEFAEVSVDGAPVASENWPIYGGPLVRADKGVLEVSDGKEGYRVDFTGDLPVYGPLKP
jgi:hypothetical protein